MDLYVDVALMLMRSGIDWSSSFGSNSAACVVFGDELSTALTQDCDGSCSPKKVGQMQVLFYTGGCLETESEE